jgi:hypothetical protein
MTIEDLDRELKELKRIRNILQGRGGLPAFFGPLVT